MTDKAEPQSALLEREERDRSSEWLGHPKGLFVLFFTEMWERFSYYGMRGLLIFYLTQHFLFSDEKSFAIYGAYTALVFLAPVLGGVLSDRYLGARKAVVFGAVLLVIGHAGMAIEGAPAREQVQGLAESVIIRDELTLQIFFLSLAFIITGVGFLKSNISTIVGALYSVGDPRRDSGFTLFYMGINLGAFSASLLCGYLGQTYGWAYGFGAAGIGMLLGLIVFVRGQPLLMGHAEPPNPALLKTPVLLGLNREHLIYIGALFSVVVFWELIQNAQWLGNLLGGFGILVLGSLVFYSLTRCEPQERDRMLVAMVLMFMAVVFFALFEQAGSSLNLLAERHVDKQVLGFDVQASQLQALNPLFIFLLGPLFAYAWIWLARRQWEPTTPVKFALGIALAGLGFWVLAYGASDTAATGIVELKWLCALYLLHTMGELCLSPVGLSMITKLSVKRLVGLMMGTWFLAMSAASYIASKIAQITTVSPSAGESLDKVAALKNTTDAYWELGWFAIAVALVLLVLSPLLRKAMHGIR